MELNTQQQKAVQHVYGPCLSTAVPGAGKTRMLTERAAYLIQQGIPSRNLLLLTFTNKAGGEMRQRVMKRLGVQELDFYVGTFHSLCANLIRRYSSLCGYGGQVTILDSDDQEAFMKQVARSLGKDIKKDEIDINLLVKVVNDYRECLHTEEEMYEALKSDDVHLAIAQEYLSRLKQHNVIDFSGLLYETYLLFKNHPNVLAKYQDLWKFVQVDEVQDTNFVQFQIIKQIGGKDRNIMMVGDISQSIYAFRGARYQNIKDFIAENPDITIIPLEKNYRSTPQIIKVADRLIRHNTSHMPIDFKTDNPDGDEVICADHRDSQAEAEWVAENIEQAIGAGWAHKDIAVFYRINRLSMDLEGALSMRGIPYKVIGGPSFYNRAEIKDAVAMLKFLINPKDGIAFERLANIVGGMGDVTVGIVEGHAKEHSIDLIEACRQAPQYIKRKQAQDACQKICSIYTAADFAGKHAGDALSLLVSRFDYSTYLHNSPKTNEKAEEREDNVKEMVNGATRFGEKNGNVKKYLDNIALVTSSDKDAGAAVTLMTMHAAKGLEFPIVIVVGCEEGILPHGMALRDAGDDKKKQAEAIEEERRICYVGFTRAEKHLLVSYCKGRKQRGSNGKMYIKPTNPSRFLKEAGLTK